MTFTFRPDTFNLRLSQCLRKARDKTVLCRLQCENKSGSLQWETALQCSNQRSKGGGRASETFLQGDEREIAKELVLWMKEDEDKVKGNMYEIQRRESSWSQSNNRRSYETRVRISDLVFFRIWRKCRLRFEQLVVFSVHFKMDH